MRARSSTAQSNTLQEKMPNATRLERWKGVSLPGQTKGLFPFGCLAFKHIPAATRTKLDMHATPMVYLGIDSASRSFLLGSLFDLHTSVAVEVTFMENVFPFRKHKAEDSPASLMWDSETSLTQGDPRLGMFDGNSDPTFKHLDKDALKSLGILPTATNRAPNTPRPLSGSTEYATSQAIDKPYALRSQSRKPTPSVNTKETRPMASQSAYIPQLTPPEAEIVMEDHPSAVPPIPGVHGGPVAVKRAREVWEPFAQAPHQPTSSTNARTLWGGPLQDVPTEHKAFSATHDEYMQLYESHHEHPWPESILVTVTEATLQTITPRNVLEALRSPQRKMWLLAMQREKECHVKNGTFGDEINLPLRTAPDRKPIPADWVFKIKHRGGPIAISELTERQFKARVVIRGQFMKEGVDFNDTFAPVAKPTTVRALLAYATSKGCLLKAGDVETAFLTAKMDCEVYVKMPPFWGGSTGPVDPNNASGNPRLLLKGVPGIPQGSRLFNETFTAYLLSIGYEPSQADKCLFFKKSSAERVAVLLWVDDFIFLCEKEQTFVDFMAAMRKKFIIPSTGPLHSFLGMEIKYDPKLRIMQLLQSSTVTVLLERAKMTECNPVTTPCPAGTTFTKADCPPDANANSTTTEYRSLVALANFLSCWTRPDITFIVNKLCKFMSNPGDKHWQLLKHLIRYLKGTQSMGITFDFAATAGAPSTSHVLAGYTDSSFADCVDTGRSTLAYCFFYGSAILSWYSKLNTYVTTSTNHSEYNALALGAKEAEWLLILFSQLESERTFTPVPILVDNSGVVSMVFNPVDHQSNKHVRISMHYTRELASNKIIVPVKIATEANVADMFTKPLPAQQFKLLSSKFMAYSSPSAPNPVINSAAQSKMSSKSAVICMLSAQGSEDEADAGDSDGAEQENKSELSDFQLNWPYPSTLKHVLGASGYDIKNTAQKFSTGREKLEIIFYRHSVNGTKVEVSRHDGMELLNRQGRPYVVCSRYPKPKPTQTATITMASPAPALTCLKCGMINSPPLALIECTSCNGKAFEWSCACVPRIPYQPEPTSNPVEPPPLAVSSPPDMLQPPPATQQPFSTPTRKPQGTPQPVPTNSPPAVPSAPAKRSGRQPHRQKAWTEQIQYIGPLGRSTTYHSMQCPTITPGSNTFVTSIEFAHAYNLKPATCCH